MQKKFLPTEIAEVLFVTPMTNIYNSLRIVLRDNNIVTAETQEEQQKIGKMVESMVKV